ncbi:MAG: HsdM family class I SAM-dependent methyltransferase [Chitinophagales bacterium]
MSANERTFQGELYRIINNILEKEESILFSKITQEENVGRKGKARFADGKLYSSKDKSNIVLFELKNVSWDATEDALVMDAMMKAFMNGYEYFVTGTPRQLAIYKTFEKGTEIQDRQVKIYTISNIRRNNDVLLSNYEKIILPKLKAFLQDLSHIVHDTAEAENIVWTDFDTLYVSKLSTYIIEASADMLDTMYDKITENKTFQKRLKAYLKDQDIFNINLFFSAEEDSYNVCQLANYLRYLKVLFYVNLQKNVPELKLKELSLPKDSQMLNEALQSRFQDVLKHDFEMIFTNSILDEFLFTDAFVPTFKTHIAEMKKLDFKQLNADIIGAIYNTLIDNQEQHDRGQHFTNTNEVDVINAFCINKNTHHIIDTACGAGTFLVRGYRFLKYFHPEFSHEQLLERLWGIEIATFPVFLASVNLCLLNIKTIDNYPSIIQSDFSEIEGNKKYKLRKATKKQTLKLKDIRNEIRDVQMPTFQACVGNPPYIRQELIGNKERWLTLAEQEHEIKKISKQSDLYVYYLMHTASLLEEGGRLGYVIASAWLDVTYGAGLQKFLLDNFKIIAIIDHQNKRSFETASINTVILILEKCSKNERERAKNKVKFVRMYQKYEDVLGAITDKNRLDKVFDFVENIEKTKGNRNNKNFTITLVSQKKLEQQSIIDSKYRNGQWGAKYLRSSKIFNRILQKSSNKLLPLSQIVDIKYGIKSGANDFFYLIDKTADALALDEKKYKAIFGKTKKTDTRTWKKYAWCYSKMDKKHYKIERNYLKPLFKSQREAINLAVDIENLQYQILMCSHSKGEMKRRKLKLLKYIDAAESLGIHQKPTNQGRKTVFRNTQEATYWYDLTKTSVVGDFIFPSKIGERYRLIDNRKALIYCDKVNYAITVKEKYKHLEDIIFLMLNSLSFRYFVDLFARQMTGSQTLSDVDVNVVKSTLVINPTLLEKYTADLALIQEKLTNREQHNIAEEAEQADKKALDLIILKALGMGEAERDELYKQAVKYVSDRAKKSKSVKTKKLQQSLSYETSLSLVADRLPEICTYQNLLAETACQSVSIPATKASYARKVSENVFGEYFVNFKLANQQKSIKLTSLPQYELFKFLNHNLGLKDTKVNLPKSAAVCQEILHTLIADYDKYFSLIKNLLKQYRSKANAQSIYRDLVFRKK